MPGLWLGIRNTKIHRSGPCSARHCLSLARQTIQSVMGIHHLGIGMQSSGPQSKYNELSESQNHMLVGWCSWWQEETQWSQTICKRRMTVLSVLIGVRYWDWFCATESWEFFDWTAKESSSFSAGCTMWCWAFLRGGLYSPWPESPLIRDMCSPE